MTRRERRKRAVVMVMWRVMNPLARRLAGIAPFWVVLETAGRRTGRARHTPLARGPIDGRTAWLISVHGAHATFARNIAADPRVRLRMRRRWYEGRAELTDLDPDVLRRFSRYSRAGPATIGIEPKLVKVELDALP